MDDYGQTNASRAWSPGPGPHSLESSIRTLGSLVRVLATIVGIVAIVIGLVYAIRLFATVHDVVQDPGAFDPILERWESQTGGEELALEIDGRRVPLGRIVAVGIVGLGAAVLAWLALGIMLAGAKVVSWTASDRAAVRKILTGAFGTTGKRAGTTGGPGVGAGTEDV